MRRFLLYLVVAVSILLTGQNSFAQEKDEKHEVHVKVKVIEDGKEKIIDTVFYERAGHGEIIEMIDVEGLADSLLKQYKICISEDDIHKKIRKKIHVISDKDCSLKKDITIKMIKADAGAKVFIHDGDSCIEKDICVEIIDGEKGEDILINDSEDVSITEEDGCKIIKIISPGKDNVRIGKDDELEIKVNVEVDETKKGRKGTKAKRKKTKK